MRILYACHQFFPEYYTGAERYGLNLARQMQRMGHHVSVVTYATRKLDSEKPVANAATRKTFEYQGVPVVALRHVDFDQRGGLHAISFGPRDPVIYQEAKRFLNESPAFDLLHCIHPMRVGEIARAVKERGLKVILHLVDYWTLCPRATLQRPDGSLCDGPDRGNNCALHCYHTEALDRLTKRWSEAQDLLTMTDVVISPSEFLIDVFRRNRVNTAKFVYLPHGADYSVLRNFARRIDDGPRTIINLGFVGTLLPHKGVDILVKAFTKIPSDNLRLKIYGGYFEMHEYYSNLLALAKGDKRIEFCGEYQFENIADVMKDIDMVVVPSLWYENAPLVISMAQMFGIPVIASRLGGITEMVADGVNGFTFHPGDVEDLADRIRMVAANPDVLKSLSKNKWSPPRIESEAFILERLYSSLIANNGTRNIQIPVSPRESAKPVRLSVAPSRPPSPHAEVVYLEEIGKLFTYVDKAKIKRVIDIGCNRGQHISNILSKEFPDAQIVGVEPKADNFNTCLKLKSDKIDFLQYDCRELRKDKVGVFDFVWCWGLIYHLDDPTLLMKSLQSITNSTSVVCMEGHIAIDGEQTCMPNPNPPIVEQTLDAQTYTGKMYKEFEEGTVQFEKDKMYEASLDNTWAFWLTYDSILRLFANYGFANILEFRGSSPTILLGPGLYYPPVDPNREWSRRLFLVSPSEISCNAKTS